MTNYYPLTAAQKMHHNWIMDYGTQQVSGVSVVASIHAQDEEQLSRKPQYQDLYRAAAFDKVVFLSGACCPGRVRKVICCKQDKGLVKD